MRKMRCTLWSVFILFCTFYSCKKNEPVNIKTPSSPEIEVIEPLFYAEGGLMLEVKINSVPDKQIHTAGLLISEDSLFREVVRRNSFELPLELKSYKYIVKSGLELGKKYYYTYYINYEVSVKETVYKQFTFGKESILKIDSISNRFASVGDTLVIYGDFNDFDIREGGMDDVKLTTYKASSNKVHMLLHETTPIKASSIYIKSTHQKSTTNTSFELIEPKLSEVEEFVRIGDDLIIKGENFSKYPNRNKVYLNNEEVQIKSFSTKNIRIEIPRTIKSASLSLSLKSNNYEKKWATPLKIKPPEIVVSPTEIRALGVYSLEIKNLPKTSIKVYYGAIECPILSNYERADINIVTIQPLIRPYQVKNVKFRLTYLDTELEFPEMSQMLDRWSIEVEKIPFSRMDMTNAAVTINHTAYTIACAKNNEDGSQFSAWKYDRYTKTFTEQVIPIKFARSPNVVSFKNKIYLYAGINGQNFYSYDPATGSLKYLTKYPGLPRLAGTMTVVKGKIYLVTGHNPGPTFFSDTQGDRSMYVYDIELDTWSKSVDFPEDNGIAFYDRRSTSSFAINNTLYVTGGANHTGQVETYAFDTESNTWKTKANIPPVSKISSLSIGDKGYLVYNKFHYYDPTRDIWQELDNNTSPYLFGQSENAVTFILEEDLYFSKGQTLFKIPINKLFP